jgi:hypothetical protein
MENVTAANRSIANGTRCDLFTFIIFIITSGLPLRHHERGADVTLVIRPSVPDISGYRMKHIAEALVLT